jgi:[acyl-carrier-protein] S-malonyltransferase
VSTAVVFPGMGPSGYSDLGKFLVTEPRARRLRRAADAALGYPLMERYRDSSADYSEFSQVAFLICCLALTEWARDTLEIEPALCTGPSFGEKPAAAYSGALTFAETVLLTARLARCEEEYFRSEHRDVVTQSVARTPEETLREILTGMSERGEWHDISCHIDQDFFMVSMREPAVERFTREVRAAGGLPLYAMRPPMHSSAFAALRRKAEEEVVGAFTFADPRMPIVADQDGAVVRTGDGVRAMLLDGFVRPVRWACTVEAMKGLGVTEVYVAGPDSLFGRVRCTTRAFTVVPVNPRTALRPRKTVPRRPVAAP